MLWQLLKDDPWSCQIVKMSLTTKMFSNVLSLIWILSISPLTWLVPANWKSTKPWLLPLIFQKRSKKCMKQFLRNLKVCAGQHLHKLRAVQLKNWRGMEFWRNGSSKLKMQLSTFVVSRVKSCLNLTWDSLNKSPLYEFLFLKFLGQISDFQIQSCILSFHLRYLLLDWT